MINDVKKIKKEPKYGKYLYEYIFKNGYVYKNKFRIVYQDKNNIYYKTSGNSIHLNKTSKKDIKDDKKIIFDENVNGFISGFYYIKCHIYSLVCCEISDVIINEVFIEDFIRNIKSSISINDSKVEKITLEKEIEKSHLMMATVELKRMLEHLINVQKSSKKENEI